MVEQTKLTELEAIMVEEGQIVMKNTKDLTALYEAIQEEKDVILTWEDKGELHSKVLITTGLLSKVKDKTVLLLAIQKTKEAKK